MFLCLVLLGTGGLVLFHKNPIVPAIVTSPGSIATSTVITDTSNATNTLTHVYVNTKYHYQVRYSDDMRVHPRSEDSVAPAEFLPPISEDDVVKIGPIAISTLGTSYRNLHQNLSSMQTSKPHGTPQNLRELTQVFRDIESTTTNANNLNKKVSEVTETKIDNMLAYQYEVSDGFVELAPGFDNFLGYKKVKIIITQSPNGMLFFIANLADSAVSQQMLASFHFIDEK